MLADHLAQAEALSLIFRSRGEPIPPSEETLAATLRCADKLYLWGNNSGLLALLESIGSDLRKLPAPWVLRLEFHRLRALSSLMRDTECLDGTRQLLDDYREDNAMARAEYDRIRILEGQALWHLNRTNEALDIIKQVRSELLSKPESSLHAYCSSALASSLLMAGSWDEARDFAIETWILAKRTGSTLYEGMGLAQLCIAERGRCRWSSSEDAAHESIKIYESIGAKYQAAMVRRSLAITLWKRGN